MTDLITLQMEHEDTLHGEAMDAAKTRLQQRPLLKVLAILESQGYLPGEVVSELREGYDDYPTLRAFLHSHSYTGNPLACAAALATLEIFEGLADIWQRHPVLRAFWPGQTGFDGAHVNVDRLGTDVAHHVAAHYLKTSDAAVLRKCHSLNELLAKAGATRIELREELLTGEDPASFNLAVHQHDLECLYSSPMELWEAGQSRPGR